MGGGIRGLLLATLCALVAIFAYRAWKGGGRETFASPKAHQVAAQAEKVFAAHGGAPTYSEYKVAVDSADPVQFHDVKELHAAKALTPAAVEKVL